MSTIRPRTPCVIRREAAGEFDRFGRPSKSATETRAKCAVIHIRNAVEDTSVRADTSASRGRGEQLEFAYHLLFHPRVSVQLGDIITFEVGDGKHSVEVKMLEPRYDVGGRVHHVEVKGNRWA